MELTVATYNIHYGVGRDGSYDLDRIADCVAAADIICFQEVTRGLAGNGHADQPAMLADRLNRYYVFGSTLDADSSGVDRDGRIINRRAQFGNMVASRWPVTTSRVIPLAKPALADVFDVQRCAVEACIETPAGGLRVYSVHLSHISAGQRRPQVETLLQEIREAPLRAPPWEGGPNRLMGIRDRAPRIPLPAIAGGDFNLQVDEAAYATLAGEFVQRHGRITRRDGLVDGWMAAGHAETGSGHSFVGMDDKDEIPIRIDYLFLTPELKPAVTGARVDANAKGSDHLPLFLTLSIDSS